MRDEQTYAIIGAAMEVHRELGHGFLEAVYQSALSLEFQDRGIPFQAEVPLTVNYKGRKLSCAYRADFLCFEEVVVETKAISQLSAADYSQVINELKATRFDRGLLINFGAPSLQYQRFAMSEINLRKSAKSADNSEPFEL